MQTRDLVFVGNFLPDRQESMLRFGELLSEGMRARGWKVQVWRPEPRFSKLGGAYRYGGLPKYLGYLDKFLVFPRSIQRRRKGAKAGTAYHILDHSNAVYVSDFKGENVLVTCHDLLQVRSALGEFPQNPVSGPGKKYQQWILNQLRQAPRVVCISEKTREDLRRLTGLSAAATPVIYMGLNYPYKPMDKNSAIETLRKCFLQRGLAWQDFAQAPNGFLVGVGGAHWYKNRTGLVSIFAALQKENDAPATLIYIGPPFDPDQEAILRAAKLDGAVIRLSGVSNEELRAAYSLARGLLFPSWEEGFGWPIAEAQACGCLVFTSNREPMTEVGGSAGCYFDPTDPVKSAQIVRRALEHPGTKIADGVKCAARWNTDRMLDEYERMYLSPPPAAAVVA